MAYSKYLFTHWDSNSSKQNGQMFWKRFPVQLALKTQHPSQATPTAGKQPQELRKSKTPG